jgi:hypothetical protein
MASYELATLHFAVLVKMLRLINEVEERMIVCSQPFPWGTGS